jgi:hypothetical protein
MLELTLKVSSSIFEAEPTRFELAIFHVTGGRVDHYTTAPKLAQQHFSVSLA